MQGDSEIQSVTSGYVWFFHMMLLNPQIKFTNVAPFKQAYQQFKVCPEALLKQRNN